jgi:uncharacterized membrane protein
MVFPVRAKNPGALTSIHKHISKHEVDIYAMNGGGRYLEIDIARGIAIVMMVVFHTLFDLNFFHIVSVNVYSGFWRYFAYATATLFLLVVGISLVISHARAARSLTGFSLAQKFLLRGAGIFCCGLLVTIATWAFLGDGYVVFGILHLIGVSIMLSLFFFRFKKWNAVIGLFIIVIGWCLSAQTGPLWLLPLGLHPATFWSVDYTPLFPWFGAVLIGIAAGEFLYPGGERRISVPAMPAIFRAPLVVMGQYSLILYLIHQPIIILLLAALTGKMLL